MNRPAETSMDLSPMELDPRERSFYLNAMRLLDEAGIRILVGGAYALAEHAGIVRHTKDFDLFLRRQDLEAACRALEGGGYRTELVFPHWLAKAFMPQSDAFVDLIFGSGNGLCPVDDDWFANAVSRTIFDRPAQLVPPEEVIWTKAFVQERERFDGADIAHVLLTQGQVLDWARLLRRFQGHEAVLLAHLLLFRYIFPDATANVPEDVMQRLLRLSQSDPPQANLCRGTLLSRAQYLVDIGERGYRDARIPPIGNMLPDDVAHWTAAIGTIK